jgi:Do/DeqQ family serine protease
MGFSMSFMRTSRVVSLALLALATGGVAVSAQPARDARVAPETKAQIQLSFAAAVRQAAPAVVNVYGSRMDRRQHAAMEEFMRRFFGEGGPGGPDGFQGRGQRSLGSGVVVDPSGLIVTNHHVVEGMTEVKIALADRREFEASIVLSDPRTDLAVLKAKGAPKLAAIEFGDSEALQVGDLVLAIGNPFGVGQTVTHGIVSALARTQVGITDYQFFIQTDAAINPGNSGGALVDTSGRLVGINTAIFSRSGGSHGIGFAIPSSMVRAVVDSARDGSKTVRRPWLGARLQNVAPDIADSIGLDKPTGALVASVQEKSPAEEAGLRRGDLILAVAGKDVDTPESFGYRFSLQGVSGKTELTVLRNGERKVLPIRLATPPETRPREPVKVKARSPFAGATFVNMSPAVADELQLEIGSEGVAVMDVDPNSAAMRLGFQKGDILLAVNREQVKSSKDIDRLSRSGASYWEIVINRGGQVLTTVQRG